MAGKTGTKETRQVKIDFIKNHINDMTYEEMAKELGCHQTYIGKIIKDEKIKRAIPEIELKSDEEFRSLKDLGYSLYEISNYGKIRNINTKKYLIPQKNNDGGYLLVRLINDNKEINSKNFKNVGRLVASIFVKNDDPVNNTEIKYIDNNKNNLSAINLKWVSKSEAHKNSSNTINRHNNDDIIKVCEMLQNKKSIKEINEIYPTISFRTIRKIKNKQIWKDIVKNYEF